MDDYRCNEQELERRKLMRQEMKRRRDKQRKIALGILALVVVLIIVLICTKCASNRKAQEEEAAREAAAAAVQAEAVTTKINIAAVGDIMCYDEQIADAKQADGTYDFAPAFAAIKPYLETADITVGNLELNFCGADAGYSGKPGFNAPESLATALKDAGFDLMQTANTYSILHGLNGLSSTIRYLTENKLEHVGTYYAQTDRDSNGVYVKNISGIRVAFFGYTKGVNNMTLPEGSEFCVDLLYKDYNSNYEEIDKDALLHSIQLAKDKKADVIVAMLHWGGEFEQEPSDSQKEIADFLFQNGVDVILGSHSHEIGPMETRTVTVDGKEKTVFVAYSLGNFFSSMDQGTSRTSCVLNVEYTMDPETGEIKLTNTSYLPVYGVDKGEESEVRYEVLPIRGAQSSSLFTDWKDTFTAAIDTLKTRTGSTYDSGK